MPCHLSITGQNSDCYSISLFAVYIRVVPSSLSSDSSLNEIDVMARDGVKSEDGGSS